MKPWEGISDQGERFHPLRCRTSGDVAIGIIRDGGSTGRVGSYGYTRDDGAKLHSGVDLVAEAGSPVFAAHEGRVDRVGEQLTPPPRGGGYGVRVYLEHDDGRTVTIYAHLCGATVKINEKLKPGYLLGWVGRSGNVDRDVPTHVHFEVRIDGHAVDPVAWLRGEV